MTDLPVPATGLLVPNMLAARAAAHPDGVALICGDGRLTFAGWQRRSAAVARGLLADGVRPGDRVALRFDETHWLDYAVAWFGVLAAGAVAVPLSPRLTDAEVDAAVAQAGCVRTYDAALPELDGPPELDGGMAPDRDGAGLPRPAAGLAQILYTSGATGRPKLIGADHANVLAGWTPDRSEPHDPSAYFVHALPMATNAGQVALLHPLQAPHTAVLLPRFTPADYCDLVRTYAADHTLLVPAMASWLVGADVGILDPVRTVALTAAPASPALLAGVATVFPHATITNNYTTTEAWPAMTSMTYDPARPGALGRPPAGQAVTVLADDGSELPAGEVGEIALSAAGVPSRTYLDTTDAARIFDGGWVRTGDLGRLDADGYLHLVDRRPDLIVTGGFNVASLEVEDALAAHPAIREAAVLGVPHEVLGTAVVAVVVSDAELDVTAVRSWLAGRLADYKLPSVLVRADTLPRTALGKIRKGELRASLAAVRTARVAPRTDDERALLELWRTVLGRSDIGVTDDFLAVGGHSLAAFEIAARAAELFGVALPQHVVLATPTVEGQAAAVAAAREEPAGPALTPIRRRPRA